MKPAVEEDDLLSNGLWMTISAIARSKGQARQTVHERVKALVAAGKLRMKVGAGRSKLVNLAQYDRAIGDTGDAVRELAADVRAATAQDDSANSLLREHQTRAAKYAADLKYLDLEERLGRLLPVDEVREAVELAAQVIVVEIERLPAQAEAVAAAVGKDGPAGARAYLKEVVRNLRQSTADALASMSRGASTVAATDNAGRVRQ